MKRKMLVLAGMMVVVGFVVMFPMGQKSIDNQLDYDGEFVYSYEQVRDVSGSQVPKTASVNPVGMNQGNNQDETVADNANATQNSKTASIPLQIDGESNHSFSFNSIGTHDDEVEFQIDKRMGYAIVTPLLNGNTDPGNKKIMVQKDDSSYFYDIDYDRMGINFQLGSGRYELTLLKHSNGNSYSVLERESFEVELASQVDPFLNPTWPVIWTDDSKAIELAKTMTEGIETDREKVTKIYNFLTENIVYDYDKAMHLENDYIPQIDQVLSEKTGICYDYSALFAGMLRSIDIPTKLVKGYKDDLNEYHAWNEVYIEEEDKWLVIDTTYDAGYNQSNSTLEVGMEKPPSSYSVHRVY